MLPCSLYTNGKGRKHCNIGCSPQAVKTPLVSHKIQDQLINQQMRSDQNPWPVTFVTCWLINRDPGFNGLLYSLNNLEV